MKKAYAEDSVCLVAEKVCINEFMSYPAVGASEWVELINLDTVEKDVGTWYIDDIGAGSPAYQIPVATVIPAGGVVLITKEVGFNNTGTDSVRLLKPDKATVIDQYTYSDPVRNISYGRKLNDGVSEWVTYATPSPGSLNPLPENLAPIAEAGADQTVDVNTEVSFSSAGSSDPEGGALTYAWDFKDNSTSPDAAPKHTFTASGTYAVSLIVTDIGGKSATDTCTVTVQSPPLPIYTPPSTPTTPLYQNEYSSNIKIVEFLPNPTGTDTGNEYIKLFNADTKDINLRNWILDDIEGGSTPFTINRDSIIKKGDYLSFFNSETKISINNDGDSVRLFDPDKKLIDSISYTGSAAENIPYILENGKWGWKGGQTKTDTTQQSVQPSVPETTPTEMVTTVVPATPNIPSILVAERPVTLPTAAQTVKSPLTQTVVDKTNYMILVQSGSFDAAKTLVQNDAPSTIIPLVTQQSADASADKTPLIYSWYIILPLMLGSVVAVSYYVVTPKVLRQAYAKLNKKEELLGEEIENIFK